MNGATVTPQLLSITTKKLQVFGVKILFFATIVLKKRKLIFEFRML